MHRLQKAQDAPLAGVCGGLAEFVGWPARRMRVLWLCASVLSGGAAGVFVYTVLAVAMPRAEDPSPGFRLEDYRQQ